MEVTGGGPRNGQSFLDWLVKEKDAREQVRAISFFPPRKGEYAEAAGPAAPLLASLGIRPFSHQAEAFRLFAAGSNVVVSTGTSSGKSLCYQLPALGVLRSGGTFLYLAPVKALAADQLQRFSALLEATGTAGPVAAYDGDTPVAERPGIRQTAGGIVSNPDMLHHAILPHHAGWARFLSRLELVVLDELHAYRGVFGIHVANIVRRLLRVAEHYGAAPQLLAASATVANPLEHFTSLTGREAVLVSEDGSPAAEKEFIFFEPAITGEGDPPRRRSLNSEAAALAAAFVRAGLKCLVFCNSRRSAELLRRYAAAQLDAAGAARIGSYRAGYTQEDRRDLENRFRSGELTVLTATSALELGMDVGDVDAVILAGWPGSHMALWQRIGRAGRRGQRSLAMLLPASDPLDEYYLSHPEAVTEGRAERAVADPFNPVIHPLHLACAAAELPLRQHEELVAPGLDLAMVPGLAKAGDAFVPLARRPHRRLGIRGGGPGRVRLVDGFGTLIGETPAGSALKEVHPGAVYLHQGDSWLVGSLDLAAGEAVLLPHLGEWYTQARSETDIDVLAPVLELPFGGVDRVTVTESVGSYVVKRPFSEDVLDERALDLPEQSYPTEALRIDCAAVAGSVATGLLPDALHALEHTLIGLLPAFILCERADIGGVSYSARGPAREPVIFIYDGHPGGVGYVRAGAGLFREWLGAARDLLRDCRCRDGCPRCILSPKCGNGNQYLDRFAALDLADALLAGW